MKQYVFQKRKDYQARMEKNPNMEQVCFFFYFFAVRYEVAYQGDIWLGAVIFN